MNQIINKNSYQDILNFGFINLNHTKSANLNLNNAILEQGLHINGVNEPYYLAFDIHISSKLAY